MTVNELIEDSRLSNHGIADYMRLRMRRIKIVRDVYSKISSDQLYTTADEKPN